MAENDGDQGQDIPNSDEPITGEPIEMLHPHEAAGNPGTGDGPASEGAPAPTDYASPEPTKRRRNPVQLIAALVVLVIIGVGGTVLAVRSGSEGGASSPENAVKALMRAAADEDLIGALDVLHPLERDMFLDPVQRLTSELQRLNVLDTSFSPSDIGGFDITVDNLAVRSEPLTDDVANTYMSATVGMTVKGADIEFGSIIDEALKDRDMDPSAMDDTAEPEQVTDQRLTTVRYKGRWYVSIGYTIAESLRAETDKPFPTSGLEPVGKADPEAAVAELFESVEQLDLTRLLKILDPGEAGALQRYAPLFLEDAQSAISDAGITWSIDDLKLSTVDSNSDVAHVSVDGFTFRASLVQEESIRAEVSVALAGKKLTGSIEVSDYDAMNNRWVPNADLSPVADTEVSEPIVLRVRKVDGLWYVSPIGSMFDVMLEQLSTQEAADVEEWVQRIEDWFPTGDEDSVDDGTGIEDGFTDYFSDGFSDDFSDDSMTDPDDELDSAAYNVATFLALDANLKASMSNRSTTNIDLSAAADQFAEIASDETVMVTVVNGTSTAGALLSVTSTTPGDAACVRIVQGEAVAEAQACSIEI